MIGWVQLAIFVETLAEPLTVGAYGSVRIGSHQIGFQVIVSTLHVSEHAAITTGPAAAYDNGFSSDNHLHEARPHSPHARQYKHLFSSSSTHATTTTANPSDAYTFYQQTYSHSTLTHACTPIWSLACECVNVCHEQPATSATGRYREDHCDRVAERACKACVPGLTESGITSEKLADAKCCCGLCKWDHPYAEKQSWRKPYECFVENLL